MSVVADDPSTSVRRPPRWGLHLLLLPFALALLWSDSVPVGDVVLLLISMVLLSAFAVAWAVWVAGSARQSRRWSWWYVVAPLAGLLVATLMWLDVPLQLRWLLAREEFVSYLDLSRQPSRDWWDPIVGYDVYLVEKGTNGEVRFYLTEVDCFFDDGGMLYAPASDPVDAPPRGFTEHVDGPWYAFCD